MAKQKKLVFETDCECSACNGTGLYTGMAERDGAAIECYKCDGTGKAHVKIEYLPFAGRKQKIGVGRVYQRNAGFVIGDNPGVCCLEDFGGMSFEDWNNGKPFPPKSEDRKHTCPAWWYQPINYKKKPDWDWCIGCGSFSGCKHFTSKEQCWERWDREFGGDQ